MASFEGDLATKGEIIYREFIRLLYLKSTKPLKSLWAT
jgi:hypothetical protein